MHFKRIDYFIIWGHGLQFTNQILNIIRAHSHLNIIKVIAHRPKTIKKLVKYVYSYDYAPLNHLKGKTRYLMCTPKQVLFIFAENDSPDEDYFGEGRFRHIESKTIKQFKEEIRNKFNPRENGKRTEHHVIHASDNEKQSHFILKYLGFNGLDYLKSKTTVFELPYYFSGSNFFKIKQLLPEHLMCRIAVGNKFNYEIKTVKICESPQYKALFEDKKIYQEYIDNFLGGPLTDDYSLEKYLKLANSFEYLKKPYENKYIATRRLQNGSYVIADGLHRATIMCYHKVKNFPAAVL